MSELNLLEPDSTQPRPSFSDVHFMCRRIGLTRLVLPVEPFGEFLRQLRESHNRGGAHVVAFDVSTDEVFDWFASRNRLADEGLIDSLIVHPAIRESLSDLAVPESKVETGLALADPFLLDGRFARCLHAGGAYWSPAGDGKRAKLLALSVCDAMFGLRYAEVALFESFHAWTRWFHGIAWDLTEVLFDRRFRRLWLFAVTDTD
jgi:hypothetical protein